MVSLVGRPRELLHPLLQPGRRVLALTAEPTAAADIRALLDARGFGASPVTVLADLGGADEVVAPADGRPHSRLAIIAIECRLDPRRGAPAARARPAGRRVRARRADHQAGGPRPRPGRPRPGPRPAAVGRGGRLGQRRHRVDARPPGQPGDRDRAARRPPGSHRPQRRRARRAGPVVVPAPPRRHWPGCPGRTRSSSAAASPPTASSPPAGTPCPTAAGWSRTRSPSRAERVLADWRGRLGGTLTRLGMERAETSALHRLAARAAGRPVVRPQAARPERAAGLESPPDPSHPPDPSQPPDPSHPSRPEQERPVTVHFVGAGPARLT